jgi:protein arginine kinase activator
MFKIKNKDELNLFLESLADRKRKTDDVTPCPSCGMSINELLSVARMGCQTCYTHFGDFAKAVITKVQAGAFSHQGKRPKNYKAVDVFEDLQKEMEKAIQEERYEDAAKFRDQIREIRKSASLSMLPDPPVG